MSEEVRAPTIEGQILALELKAIRAMREHILGDTAALARIQTTDTQIAALRTQLTPE